MRTVDDIVTSHATRILKPFGICKQISRTLVADLLRSGHDAHILRCSYLLTPAPDADDRWLDLGSQFYWVHYVVQAGDRVFDLTRRQFYPGAAQPHVQALAATEAEWESVTRYAE